MPAWGGIERLTALVGRGRALALMTTGRILDADAALAQGLFDEVVPREQFDQHWRDVAAQIARAPRDALVGIKAAQRAAFPTAHPISPHAPSLRSPPRGSPTTTGGWSRKPTSAAAPPSDTQLTSAQDDDPGGAQDASTRASRVPEPRERLRRVLAEERRRTRVVGAQVGNGPGRARSGRTPGVRSAPRGPGRRLGFHERAGDVVDGAAGDADLAEAGSHSRLGAVRSTRWTCARTSSRCSSRPSRVANRSSANAGSPTASTNRRHMPSFPMNSADGRRRCGSSAPAPASGARSSRCARTTRRGCVATRRGT